MGYVYAAAGGADGPAVVFLAGVLEGPWSGWISLWGLMIVVLLLIPNIVYALRCRGEKNLCDNRLMNVIEQVGRYGSMLFMVLVFGKGSGFPSAAAFVVYLAGNLVLLTAYWVLWGIYYFKTKPRASISRQEGPTAVFIAGKPAVKRAAGIKMLLAVVPSLLFLLSGITLMSIPLILCALFFAAGHIYVTFVNIEKSIQRP